MDKSYFNPLCFSSLAAACLLAYNAQAVETPGWTQISNPTRFTCILPEDSIIWLGSDAGLLRIIPETGTTAIFNTGNSGLANNHITALARSRSGVLWIGTKKGLAQYKDGKWAFHDYSNSPLARNFGWETVLSLAVDSRDNLWVGMRGTNSNLNLEGGGLHYFDGAWKKEVIPEKGGAQMSAIIADPNGTVWFTETRLQLAAPLESAVFAASAATAEVDNSIKARVMFNQANSDYLGLFPDFKGFFWTDFDQRGYQVRWGGDFNKPVSLPAVSSTTTGLKYRLTTDKKGEPWIWAEGKIHKREDTTWVQRIALPDSLNLKSGVKELKVDDSDHVYLRSDSSLAWLRNGKWLSIRPTRPFTPWTFATCMAIDTTGRKFVGSLDGLYYESGAGWSRFEMANSGLPSNSIGKIGFTPQGALWMLSGPNVNPTTIGDATLIKYSHLTRYDGNTWKTFKDADGYPSALAISGFASTPGGDIWVSTQSGLYRWNGAFWSAHHTEQEFLSIIADRSGNIYAGGIINLTRHISRYDAFDGRFLSKFIFPPTLITDLKVDAHGDIWRWGQFAGHGFVHRSLKGAQPFDHMPPEAYPYYVAQSMTSDRAGGMWMAVQYINRDVSQEWRNNKLRFGLTRPLNRFDYGHRHGLYRYLNGAWTEYNTKTSGLQNEEITAMAVAPDGTMWFATGTGLSSFKPSEPPVSMVPKQPGSSGKSAHVGRIVSFKGRLTWQSIVPGFVRIEQILVDGTIGKLVLTGNLPAGRHELSGIEGPGRPLLRIESAGMLRYFQAPR